MKTDKSKLNAQEEQLDIPVFKRSYFDLLINWLEECRGKKAMIYVFCWMMIPFVLCFLAMIAGLFSVGLSLLFLFLALGVFIVMTIGLFTMLMLSK